MGQKPLGEPARKDPYGGLTPARRGKPPFLAKGNPSGTSPLAFASPRPRLLEQLYAFARQGRFDVWLGGIEINAGTEVYPDASLIQTGCGANRQPHPADVLMVFEVSQGSLGYDLGRTATLYALSGISE